MFNKPKNFIEKGEVVQSLLDEIGQNPFLCLDSNNLVRKKERENRDLFNETVRPQVREIIREDYVECHNCGSLIKKERTLEVAMVGDYSNNTEFYCKLCKPAYDKVVEEYNSKKDDYTTRYFKDEVECTKTGKIKK